MITGMRIFGSMPEGDLPEGFKQILDQVEKPPSQLNKRALPKEAAVVRQEVLDRYSDVSSRSHHWAMHMLEHLRAQRQRAAVIVGIFRFDRAAPLSVVFADAPCKALHYWVLVNGFYVDGTADQFKPYCDNNIPTITVGKPEELERYQELSEESP